MIRWAPTDAHERRLVITSASMRVVLGLACLTLLPLAYPRTAAIRTWLVVYVAISAATMVLIIRRLGGMPRTIASGIYDIATITLVVHYAGSTETVLLTVYVFAAILTVIAIGPGIGMLIAVGSSGVFGLLLVAEQMGWTPLAPTATSHAAAATWAVVTSLTVLSTSVIARLMKRVLDHEDALERTTHRLEEVNRELEEANARLAQQSEVDPLTELYNRRYIMSRLEHELARVRRGAQLGLAMLDLDRFKLINDRHGHQRGDELLQAVARSLRDAVREVDIVGRYGGDEMVVVFVDPEPAELEAVARRLVRVVRDTTTPFDEEAAVTVSIGLALAHLDDDAASLIGRADDATYEAKKAGGDRVVRADAQADDPGAMVGAT